MGVIIIIFALRYYDFHLTDGILIVGIDSSKNDKLIRSNSPDKKRLCECMSDCNETVFI